MEDLYVAAYSSKPYASFSTYPAVVLAIGCLNFQAHASTELIIDYSDGNKGKEGYSQQIFYYHLEDESVLNTATKDNATNKQSQKLESKPIYQVSHDVTYKEYLGVNIHNNRLDHSIKNKNSTLVIFKSTIDQTIKNNISYVCEATTDIKVMVMFKGGFNSTNNIIYSLPKNYNLPKFDLDKTTSVKNTNMTVKDLLMCEATRHGMTSLDSSKSIGDMIQLIDDHIKTDWTTRIIEAKKYKINLNGQYFKEDVDKTIADAKSSLKG